MYTNISFILPVMNKAMRKSEHNEIMFNYTKKVYRFYLLLFPLFPIGYLLYVTGAEDELSLLDLLDVCTYAGITSFHKEIHLKETTGSVSSFILFASGRSVQFMS